MIRVVLAVVLGSALLGVALPAAESADGDRITTLAVDELERVNETAARLAAGNDPVDPSESPPATTIELEPPEPTFAESGRIHLDDDELRWVPADGRNETVETTVPTRVDGPIVVVDRAPIRLSLVRTGEEPVVRIQLGREGFKYEPAARRSNVHPLVISRERVSL